LGQLPFSITVISVAALVLLFLFIQIEKKPPFPLIDFKLLKKDNTFCKYNYYDYRANYTDGCVSKSSYFDTKPTTGRIWKKCIKYSKCSTALYDSIIDFSVASGFLVSKFGNLRPTTIRTIVTTIGFFVLFMFHSTEASIAACLSSCWISINADRFSECRPNFDSKTIQWNIIGAESFNFPYWILGGTCDCRKISASKPGICRIRYRWYLSLIPVASLV
jgi:hypothetical protein